MKVFFSNRLEILADKLRDRLFFAGEDAFAKKTVVVPTLLVKNFLLHRWAQDPLLGVATGIKMETLPSFLKMTPKVELSLIIEDAIRQGGLSSLDAYLQEGGPKRLHALCDELAALFLQYLLYGQKLEGWQLELWGKAAPVMEAKIGGSVFLFHFSFLPPPIADLFAGAEGFFLSPSQMFWGDAISVREKRFLVQKVQGAEDTFEGNNRLLGNFGKMGRKFLTFLEGEEDYQEPGGHSFLEKVQKEMLFLEEISKEPDDSIQIHAATSKMREVEVLKETLLRLRAKSKDVLVLAPDIAEYAPYIHAVFQGTYDYTIADLELLEESLLAKGLHHLLKLPSLDFSINSVLELFSFPNFLDKFGLSSEEAHEIGRWVKKVHIRYGLEGLDRLLIALIATPQEKELHLDFTDASLLAKLVEIFQLLKQKLDLAQEKSVAEWMTFFASLAETFFSLSSEDELLLKEFRAHTRIQGLKFSYASIERMLQSILSKKSGTFQAGALHAIRFESLKPGASISAATICLLGMEEDLFPRRDRQTSLCQTQKGYRPSRMDEDRYLFLELLLSARKHFLLFYTKIDPEDGKEKEGASVLREIAHLGVPVHDHPPPTFAPKARKEPLFAFQPQKAGEKDWAVDIRMLKEFARHPLKYQFVRAHGVEFEWEENRFPEFALSHLDLYQLRRESLETPVEEILAKAERKGILPEGSYREAAEEKVRAAVEEYQTNLGELGVHKLQVVDVDLQVPLSDGRSVHVYGRLEDVAEQGLVFHGKDCLEDLVKVWPLYMIYRATGGKGKLLFSKSGEEKEMAIMDPIASLGKYLLYFERSHPSPFLPDWAEPFLQGDEESLDKAMQDSANGFFPDPVVQYTAFPPAEYLYRHWSPVLKEALHELL